MLASKGLCVWQTYLEVAETGEVVGAEVVGGEVGTTVGEVVGAEVVGGESQSTHPHVSCTSDSNSPPSAFTMSFSVTLKLPEP